MSFFRLWRRLRPDVSPRHGLGHTRWSGRGKRLAIFAVTVGMLAAMCACSSANTTAGSSASGQTNGHHFVGPKQYYLALGDSLAFGYQPDLNFSNSYPREWFNTSLKNQGVKSITNFGCAGATTQSFIHGPCPNSILRHSFYSGSQLHAALNFIHQHPGQVSPVSLDIGADDMLPLLSVQKCQVAPTFDKRLATVDRDLTHTILPQLTQALKSKNGRWSGDLVMMNYYDPFTNVCPHTTFASKVQTLDQHLARDAAQFHVPVVNVFQAFGGSPASSSANARSADICKYTWACSNLGSLLQLLPGSTTAIHPNNTGYQVIANAFKSVTGY